LAEQQSGDAAPEVPSGRAEERRGVGSEGLEPELIVEALERRHDPYAALRVANYRAYAGGFVFSSTGLGMLSTAIAWEVWQLTQSALALGIVGLTRAIPVILLALPAGHLVDIYNRKWLLASSQICYALLACLLAAASYARAPVEVFYFVLVLTGCVRVVNGPTRQSILPLIVPRGVFSSAVTWNSGVFQFSAVTGPLLAGAVIAAAGDAWPVYVCAGAGTAVFGVTALFIRLERPSRGENRFSVRSMFAGLGHVWREKTILATITLDLLAVLFGGAMALLPIYADHLVIESTFLGLNHASVRLGFLRAAPFVGALLMALVMAHRLPMRRAGRALLWSVAAYGMCWIVFGVSPWFWVSLGMLALAGAVDNISVVIRHILVQLRTPDALRGRVSAVNSVFIESSNELGAFESGLVAGIAGRWLGPMGGAMVSVVSGGIGTILVVAAVAWKWPEIRRLGRLEE
jgi:MFS family permease